MTSLLLAALIQPSLGEPRIIEIPDPSAPRTVVQAVIRLPYDLGQREAAAWLGFQRLPTAGGQDFTPFKLMDLAGLTGIPPEVEVEDGLVRVQITAPGKDLTLAGQMAESLVLRPYLPQAEADRLVQEASGQPLSGWALALQPTRLNLTGALASRKVDGGLFLNLQKLAIQPQNLTLIVSGPFEAGEGRAELRTRFTRFDPAPRRTAARFDPLPQPRTSRADGLASAELRGKPLLPTDPCFPAAVLAGAALGTGKEASVFRVLRQKLRLSYEQAFCLWPTRTGWLPRTIMIQKAREDSSTLAARMREALTADIEAWTEEDLARAKAMVQTAFRVGLPDGPLWLGKSGPAGPSLEDRTALAALFASYGADPSLVGSLPARAAQASLAEMKAAALQAISGGDIVMAPSGSG